MNNECNMQKLFDSRKQYADEKKYKEDREWDKDKCAYLKQKVEENEARISELEEALIQVMSEIQNITNKPFILK